MPKRKVARALLAASTTLFIFCSLGHASERGQRLYKENCAPCHGESGKGDGPGTQSLPVRPADHTNGMLMNARSDTFLRDVIARGGSAMGLSPFMPSWNGVLKDEDIRDLVAYIRSLARRVK